MSYLFCGAITIAALIFWSMKNRTDKVKPRNIDAIIPVAGKVSK